MILWTVWNKGRGYWVTDSIDTDECKLFGSSNTMFTRVFEGSHVGAIYDTDGMYRTEKDAWDNLDRDKFIEPFPKWELVELLQANRGKRL